MVKNSNKKGILRVVDANFNRCKEGLRVVEDIFRFIVEDDKLRKKLMQYVLVPVSLIIIIYAYPAGIEIFRKISMSQS